MKSYTREFDWGDYFDWLKDIIHSREQGNYELLISYLRDQEFTFKIPKDLNRSKDGKGLRLKYADQYLEGFYDESDILGPPCSVLEMLVALSLRTETDIMGEPGNDRPWFWFWDMIDNLGLVEYTDNQFEQDEIEEIVDIWLNREFKTNGSGSIFPLKNPKRNQKRIEIWYQLSDYIEENYPFV